MANPINRYSISARQNLKANPDGSTDLYIQNEFAGRGQGIELAAGTARQVHPDAAAVLAEREAIPRSSTASWKIPPVKKVG